MNIDTMPIRNTWCWLVVLFMFARNEVAGQELTALRSLHAPVLVADGNVVIRKVLIHTKEFGKEADMRAFCAPIHAGAETSAEQMADINLISLAKIRVSFEYRKKDGRLYVDSEVDFVIDVSNFSQPKNVRMTLYDIVQEILVCLRIDHPPSLKGKVAIKIVGAPEPALFESLQGLLWHSGNQKKDRDRE